MENFIGQIITPELDSQFIKSVVVPNGGLHGGQVVTLEQLANFSGNHEVYTCGEPTTGEMFGETMAIVLNQGFETYVDSRRLEGQPNYYTYEYNENEIVSAVFIAPHIKYLISADTIGSATRANAGVGKYLVPQNALYDLAVADIIPDYCACALKIVAVYNVPLGGNYGGQFATAYVCVGETQGVERGTDILTFSLEEQVGEATINRTAHTIEAILESTAMVESQVATFTLSDGATAFVGEAEQESGVTENDFTDAVEYDIVAESQEVETWTVSVRQMLTAPAIALVDNEVSWSDVTGAASYNLYKDGVLSQENVTSPITLTESGIYSLKAIPTDTVTHADSDLSNEVEYTA